MADSKPWYLSRTIWAALVTIALSVLGMFGMSMNGVDDAALVEAIVQAATAVAGVVALVGRLFAQSRIG